MDILLIIAQFLLSLSMLVLLHELGHFLPAKWFKTRVDKFYLFFDPWFSLFKFKKGETEYGIGWIPLGGYVKIAGMIDESNDKEFLNTEPQPWEFRSKPTWQRLIIMLGGVIVNFVLGFFIFAMLLFFYGKQYLPNQNVPYGIAVLDSVGIKMGFKSGDVLQKIGDTPLENFEENTIRKKLLLDDASTVTVLRDRQSVTLTPAKELIGTLARRKEPLFSVRIPMVVDTFLPNSPAVKAGIMKNDSIVMVNNDSIRFRDQVVERCIANKNKTIPVVVMRQNQPVTLNVALDSNGQMGAVPKPLRRYCGFKCKKYSFLASFPVGISEGINVLTTQIKAFGSMSSSKGHLKFSESIGGLGSIASLFPSTWVWEDFWRITALLSIILGFMNLLPIPALDGGHVVFLLWEMVTGRKPNDKFMEYAQTFGVILLITLMLYANGLDVFKNWEKITDFFGKLF